MPSHGPAEQPDVDALIETLDTFWRFLRGTGRMRSGSAEAKDLVREARRAAPRMLEACDPGRHSPSKVLTRFAAASGPPLDEASSVEELHEVMQQVMEDFNALLEDEFDDDFDDEDLDDFAEATWELLPDPFDLAPPPDLAAAAEQVRASPFIRQCLRLARWIGDGKPVTARGVLHLTLAREVYAELGLGDWELGYRRRAPFPSTVVLDEAAATQKRLLEDELAGPRSASETRPLARLWLACQAAGLITVGEATARATPEADPRHTRSEEEELALGLAAIVSVVGVIPDWDPVDPLLRVLLPFLSKGVEQVTEEAVQDWWWSHPDNFFARVPHEDSPELRDLCDRHVQQLLWLLEDTGVWRRSGGILHRTALGMEVAMALWEHIEERILRP